ncbi:lantibiotic dehydratase C-terminal domain-containing protein [Micromonospora sp. NBC_01813]|uniref:lantibiotic dehydratase C-terminal domain-containing protein n=1 Tax=Micromonospora sp. NBC_01813 TaxID=2975988 RepID=UPI002DDA0A10|nr:lantibiotic dehydratase C-terminal domain-containing protein [Micromonospora sp. NBC_01813]WSA07811.1 lantibiotic biosynthesis protein [Micromonospora sp. NBC_01813]
MTRTLIEPAPAADLAAGDWQAIHIYYAANPQPLLVQCVQPLIAGLRADGLLAGHFFINYWLEGPHVRLRLKPATVAATAEVKRRAEAAITEYLRVRPALYHVDAGFLEDFYNSLFDMEFSADEKSDYLRGDGRMNLRENNTYSYEPYEPEYGKYGGEAGIELAEWHFAHSSEMVVDAIRRKNLHLRTVLLGTSAQLMMVMSACFLPATDDLVDYLDRYHKFWRSAFPDTNYAGDAEYQKQYAATGADIGRRFAEIRHSLRSTGGQDLPGLLRGWAAHCLELRDRAAGLAERGQLVFRSWDGQRDEIPTDPQVALPVLLSPYMHMTNNRLHVTITDEAYLAYMLGRALREHGEES